MQDYTVNIDSDVTEFFNALTRKDDINLAAIKFTKISQIDLRDFNEINKYLDSLNKDQICSILVHYLSDFCIYIQSDYSTEQLKKNDKLYAEILDILLEKAVKLNLRKEDYNLAVKNLEIKNKTLAEKNYFLLNDLTNKINFKYVFYTNDNTKIECKSYEEAFVKAAEMYQGKYIIKLLNERNKLQKKFDEISKSLKNINKQESVVPNFLQKKVTFIEEILINYHSLLNSDCFPENSKNKSIDEIAAKLPKFDIISNSASPVGAEKNSLSCSNVRLTCSKMWGDEVFETCEIEGTINILSLENKQKKPSIRELIDNKLFAYSLDESKIITKSAGSLKLNTIAGSIYENNVNFLERYILNLETKKNKYSSEKEKIKIEEKIKLLNDLSQMLVGEIQALDVIQPESNPNLNSEAHLQFQPESLLINSDPYFEKRKENDDNYKKDLTLTLNTINNRRNQVSSVINEWKAMTRLDKKNTNAHIINNHRFSFFNMANKLVPESLRFKTKTEKVIDKLLDINSPIVLNNETETRIRTMP